jgi:hypothetical protein
LKAGKAEWPLIQRSDDDQDDDPVPVHSQTHDPTPDLVNHQKQYPPQPDLVQFQMQDPDPVK